MTMATLAELQAALQDDILTGQTRTLPRLKVPEAASPAARLHVYQHAYAARLVEILAEDYDTTWTFLGDQAFHDLARAYIRDCPSQTPNARWFGARFPDFLATRPALADIPAIADIARLERALADAFDAADAPVAGLSDLAALGVENIERATFALHPSVTLLGLGTNAHAIFSALRGDTAPPAPEALDDRQWIVIWRHDLMCRHLALGSEAGTLLDHARQGYDFARLAEVSMLMGDPDTAATRLAGHLQHWIGLGLITAIATV